MTTITLENIKSEHAKVADLIAAFEAQSKGKKLSLPAVEIELQPGEHYAGMIVGKEGEPSYHLVLMAQTPTEDQKWKAATKWAEKTGGSLPTRREQSLLFANLKEQFEERYYWSCEQHASDAGYAWYQSFDDGHQDSINVDHELCARAVRRVQITGEQE